MSLVRSLLNLRTDPGSGFGLNPWTNFLDSPWGKKSSAGMRVDHDTALAIAAVYASVRIIAETIGSLPLKLYQRMPDGSKREAKEDPLFDVIQMPNEESTQMHFFQTVSGHGALRGNAYAELIRDSKGRVTEMWPLHPDRVLVQRRNGLLVYQVLPDQAVDQSMDYTIFNTGPTKYLFGDNIMHFKLMSVNGVTGLSPLQYAKNNFGLAMAQEEFSSKLFSNGAMPRGLLVTDEDIDDPEFENIKEQWKALHSGVWNAHKTAVLPKGVTWQQLSMTAEDAQSLLSRKFQIAEIARIFKVPLHLLQDLDRSTNNNIEQQSLEFVIHTIRNWIVAWEQTMTMQVLTKPQRDKGLFLEFNHEALLRGDITTETTSDNTYIMNGVYSVNEVRLKKGMNPVEGGDEHYVGLNMGAIANQQELDDVKGPSTPPDGSQGTDIGASEQPSADKKKLKKLQKLQKKPVKKASERQENVVEIVQNRAKTAFLKLIQAEIAHCQRKEAQALVRQAKKLRAGDFEKWLDAFVLEMRDEMSERLNKVLTIAAEGLVGEDADVSWHITRRVASVSETYADGIRVMVQQLIERTNEGESTASWPLFLQLLESPGVERDRERLSETIATNEVDAILELEGEQDDADAA